MSFLAPFFLLGALVISVPLLFHLIRRSPRGRVPFSSLMFLRPSPPRITRRSKLDNLLLLFLRAAAVCLLAFAFARPFLREAATLGLDAPGRRVALLVDTSASMRRDGVWEAALEKCRETLREIRDVDVLSVHVFDDEVRTLLNFEDSGRVTADESRALVEKRLEELEPGWRATNLGGALVAAADGMGDKTGESRSGEIVLVSDLQRGAELAALETFEWPEGVHLTIARVEGDHDGNASLGVLREKRAESTPDTIRVRVSREDARDAGERLELRWAVDGRALADEVASVFVPPGESRVVRMRRPAGARPDRIVLSGDRDAFDNTHWIVPPAKRTRHVVWAGRERADDAGELRYFVERALQGDAYREVRFTTSEALGNETPPDLALATGPIDATLVRSLRSYASRGGTVLAVLKESADAPGLSALLDVESVSAEEAPSADYAMLADIDFAHPVFALFADPRFNDFTQIRFWRHRKLELPADASDIKVLARFDDGSPAILESPVGDGRVLVFTSGWHPRDSQLALSSKFVPLVSSLLSSESRREREDAFVVGERADSPGIYELDTHAFAVNLAAAESRTAPLAIEELENRGVRLDRSGDTSERERQMRDLELERSQKLWQWLIAAALAALALETWLGGRLARATS